MLRTFARLFLFSRRAIRRIKVLLLRSAFKRHGRNFRFDPDGIYSYETIEVGDDVFIGPGAVFQASLSSIQVGNKVMFGPNVTIMGGDHNISESGKFMIDVINKRPENDQVVTIEDDVWVGTGAIILKGVRLGRGCVVAAGAVVTKNVLPYVIVAGVPAKGLALRFPLEEVFKHEEKLYLEPQRLSRDYLQVEYSKAGFI